MLRSLFFSRSTTTASSVSTTRGLCLAVTTTQQRFSHSAVQCPSMNFLLHPTQEHSALRDTVQRFAQTEISPQAKASDLTGTFNHALFKRAGELGLLGLTVPEQYGGSGMDATASVIVHEEMSRFDPGFCLAYLAHSLLFVNNFYYAANDSQRQKYCPKVCSGEWIGAMGMSEPNAGTDVLSMHTNAKRSDDHTHYILNGSKIWITNGPVADVFLIYAKVQGKLTAFILEKGMPGFTVGSTIDKCGMKASLMSELRFENVAVPRENLLGEEGKGAVHMMRNLEIERLGLAAMALGIGEQCVHYMVQYANQRVAFGQKIIQYGQMQKYIAESFSEVEAARAFIYAVARSVAPGVQNRIGSDAVKLFASPVAKRAADNAMQVMGAMGYVKDTPIERLWRDAKLLEIGGGTLEAHHKNLAKDLSKLIL